MNVLILEDEPRSAERLAGLLRQCDPAIRVLAQLPSVAEGLAWFAAPGQGPGQPGHPDLLLLDIHLEDGTGFQLIERAQLTLPIVFTTAFDAYTLLAFKTNSVDYLLKPVAPDELAAALAKFRTRHAALAPDLTALLRLLGQLPAAPPPSPAYKPRFMVSSGTKLRSIETADVAYFFFADKATWLMPRQGSRVDVEYSLDKLTELLDPDRFFRISRSFLVAREAIGTIHAFPGGKIQLELLPPPRQEVFVSGDRVTPFKEWLGK
ncbi:LytR/AlgR family response regulator transcription factor [Hymenobacter rigui]|uniref:DNA-binding response regulator n=1 Tax=Hymenobacter rigui TaxID=334424 RepID=A0A428K9K0_9BACT|nr:LytTR family DNA-binding domain-containing protein [Hymenobacter rigui]RSK43075.1 DNA-binding response regulator [Hymenobacter rigui]